MEPTTARPASAALESAAAAEAAPKAAASSSKEAANALAMETRGNNPPPGHHDQTALVDRDGELKRVGTIVVAFVALHGTQSEGEDERATGERVTVEPASGAAESVALVAAEEEEEEAAVGEDTQVSEKGPGDLSGQDADPKASDDPCYTADTGPFKVAHYQGRISRYEQRRFSRCFGTQWGPTHCSPSPAT